MTPNEMLHESLLVMFRRKWLIMLVFVLGVAGLCGYLYVSYPLHKATVLILVHENPREQPILFQDIVIPAAPNFRSDAAKNLIEISRSTDLARQVVNEFGLVQRRQRRAEAPETGRDKFWYAYHWAVKLPFKALEWAGVLEDKGPTYEHDAVREFLDDRQDIQYLIDTELVYLSVWEEDPVLAVNVVNRFAELLVGKAVTMSQAKASVAYLVTRDLARQAEDEYDRAEAELARFKSEQNLFAIETQQQQLLDRIDRARSAYDGVCEQEAGLKGRLAELQEQLKGVPERIPLSTVVAQNPLIKEIELSQYLNEVELASQERLLGDANPDVLVLRTKVARAGDTLREKEPTIVASETTTLNPLHQDLTSGAVNAETELKSVASRGKALQSQIASLQDELRSLADKEPALHRLERGKKTQEDVYGNLENKLAKLEVEQLNRLSEFDIRIVDHAYLPANKKKDWPSWKKHLLVGAPVVLVLGILAAFLVNYFDETFMTPLELERRLGAPVLGCIPKVRKGNLPIRR